MDIVFNINQLGLEGLGTTITSLVRNCPNSSELKLWFLCSGFHKKDKDNISEILESEGFKGTAEFIDFDAKLVFGHLRSLHGDWTTYGRLLITKYVKSNTALYLDADLIILLDVLILKDFDFKGAILAAESGTTVAWTFDKSFFIDKLNWSPDQPYFNAGILLFNLKQWRELDIDSKWKELANKYPNDLLSNDQTLLNAVCEGNFARLTNRFNNAWFAGSKEPEFIDDTIIHFVGSPKPWDLFGKTVHGGYKIWLSFTTNSWKRQYGKITFDKVRRTYKIRKSILNHLKKRLLKHDVNS